ncbi:Hypothetical protein D9617_9g024040 [Elsinoe fawcettii]|nr:Hypothetical protein D9617_9g024040 [Elsinoe fawcettii]
MVLYTPPSSERYDHTDYLPSRWPFRAPDQSASTLHDMVQILRMKQSEIDDDYYGITRSYVPEQDWISQLINPRDMLLDTIDRPGSTRSGRSSPRHKSGSLPASQSSPTRKPGSRPTTITFQATNPGSHTPPTTLPTTLDTPSRCPSSIYSRSPSQSDEVNHQKCPDDPYVYHYLPSHIRLPSPSALPAQASESATTISPSSKQDEASATAGTARRVLGTVLPQRPVLARRYYQDFLKTVRGALKGMTAKTKESGPLNREDNVKQIETSRRCGERKCRFCDDPWWQKRARLGLWS